MVDWSKKFKTEYDAAKTEIAKTNDFEGDWRPLIRKLEALMTADGFDGDKDAALNDLRSYVKKGPKRNRTYTEDEGILRAAEAWTPGDTGTVNAAAKRRSACLKFLRHIYLQNKYGNRRVWVFSLPTDFTDWPSRHLAAHATTTGAVKRLLASHREHFSNQQRRHLGSATQHALAWCQKAGMVLANAATSAGTGANPDRDIARAMVRRWFAESGLADATLNTYITTLTQGFRDMIAMLNRGHFIVTDWVPFRGTSDADELDFLRSEAFTFASRHEGLDVVYIESAFFGGNNVLSGRANWIRIIVHELTHLVCGTEDVDNGQTRYAWYGIGPHAGYPGSDCVRNAENWAFFAADCGGALSDGERNTALTII